MSKVRYFKGTDGKITFFRASPSRVYLSATIFPDWRGLTMHWHARGPLPMVEISRQEYVALIALKNERGLIEQAKYEAKHGPWHRAGKGQFLDAPRDSWIFNSELPAAQPSSVEG